MPKLFPPPKLSGSALARWQGRFPRALGEHRPPRSFLPGCPGRSLPLPAHTGDSAFRGSGPALGPPASLAPISRSSGPQTFPAATPRKLLGEPPEGVIPVSPPSPDPFPAPSSPRLPLLPGRLLCAGQNWRHRDPEPRGAGFCGVDPLVAESQSESVQLGRFSGVNDGWSSPGEGRWAAKGHLLCV